MVAVGLIQCTEDVVADLFLQVGYDGSQPFSRFGEVQPEGAPVGGIRPAKHETFAFQPVYQGSDSASGDAELLGQIAHSDARRFAHRDDQPHSGW